MSKERNQEIAQTILTQLGGINRLNAMIGVKDVYSIENGVRFRIKCRGAKANYVKIQLNSMDLYDMELGKVHGESYKVKGAFNSVYGDMLKQLISNTTGLALSL